MSRGLPKFFNVYDPNEQLIIERGTAVEISRFLKTDYTRLYDFANLNRSIQGHRIIYVKTKPPTELFYCQNCTKKTKSTPVLLSDDQRGELKMCSDRCKLQMTHKIERINKGL